MGHNYIYTKFVKQFPEVSGYVQEWFPNGKNSIRVRICDGSDVFYTYNGPFDWCYESLESHIKKMLGGANVTC